MGKNILKHPLDLIQQIIYVYSTSFKLYTGLFTLKMRNYLRKSHLPNCDCHILTSSTRDITQNRRGLALALIRLLASWIICKTLHLKQTPNYQNKCLCFDHLEATLKALTDTNDTNECYSMTKTGYQKFPPYVKFTPRV